MRRSKTIPRAHVLTNITAKDPSVKLFLERYTDAFGGYFFEASSTEAVDVSSFTNFVLSYKATSGTPSFVIRIEDDDVLITGASTCTDTDNGEGEYIARGITIDGTWRTMTISRSAFNTAPVSAEAPGFIAQFQGCINQVDWTQIGGTKSDGSTKQGILGLWAAFPNNTLTIDEVYYK